MWDCSAEARQSGEADHGSGSSTNIVRAEANLPDTYLEICGHTCGMTALHQRTPALQQRGHWLRIVALFVLAVLAGLEPTEDALPDHPLIGLLAEVAVEFDHGGVRLEELEPVSTTCGGGHDGLLVLLGYCGGGVWSVGLVVFWLENGSEGCGFCLTG